MEKESEKGLALTKTQAFVMQTLRRKDITGVDYNPRVITPEAARRLRENLAKVGQTGPCSVNHRTKTNGWDTDEYVILSGHQRFTAIDALEGTDDYAIEVAVVCLDRTQEAAQNVFLNNHATQGQFDFDMLGDLMVEFQELGVPFADAGFGVMEVGELYPDLVVEMPSAPLPVDPATKGEITSSPGGKTGKNRKGRRLPSQGDSGDGDGGQATPPQDTIGTPPVGVSEGQERPSADPSGDAPDDPAAAYAAKKRENGEDGKADNLAVFVFRDQDHLREFRDLINAPAGERYFSGMDLIGWLKRLSRQHSDPK